MTPRFFSNQPSRAIPSLLLGLGLLILHSSSSVAATLNLSSMDLGEFEQQIGAPWNNRGGEREPITIAGEVFKNGVGTRANSKFVVDPGDAERFTASVGIQDHPKAVSAEFRILGDGKELWKSGVMKAGQPAQKVDVAIKGVKLLTLEVTHGPDGSRDDFANWADAKFEYTAITPKPGRYVGDPVILTPKPGPAPRVNGPSIFGVRPGSPFLYSIPVTGERPIKYAVDGLPQGLKLDEATGRITGSLGQAGEYPVTFRAENRHGKAEKRFRIVVGETIALTPPLGWNSWNCWGAGVTQAKVLAAARAMVASGLDRHGWTYINIDDTWQGKRGGPLNAIQPDPKSFPDLKGLCDEIHGMGLKAGIYSTPWITSYAFRIGGSANNPEGTWTHPGPKREDAPGQYSFAVQDARQWAEWGIDYLKYDWCPNEVPETEAMAKALQASGRDIVYSLSNSTPFQNIEALSKLANCWRTTGDIVDIWASVKGIGMNKDKWAPYQAPGHFNDPDMLVVGHVGWGNPHPSRIKPNEQYTHISLWALLGAPLLIGCDMEKLDDFTLGLLTNDEVLEVNQDALCKQGTEIAKNGNARIYAKPLEDGTWAVGLFNLGYDPISVTVNWSDLKLTGERRVRDLWRQKDLGVFGEKYTTEVGPHGVMLIRVF